MSETGSEEVDPRTRMDALKSFLKLESAGGIILMFTAALAMIVANSPLSGLYDNLIDLPLAVQIGSLEINKPLLLWINDGLMAIFFLLVGLELKREVLAGELSDLRQVVLPALGAVGGMVVPAAIYVFFNREDPVAIQGWAIPAATDIAFALGILALVGSRVPLTLKVFLVSIAIFDDLGAIIIIALFYTSELSMTALMVALACIPVLFFLNRRRVTTITPYILIGVVMWVAVLKSGVHATLAGVVVALFIPFRGRTDEDPSPLKTLEHDLHGPVAFAILPIFAFANSGIPLLGMKGEDLLHPVPLGIAAGLFLGKQIGIVGFCLLGLKMGIARMPTGMNLRSLHGASVLCGVGFTMSLFIGSLAFENMGMDRIFDERLGIVLGSIVSGVVGYFLVRGSVSKSGESQN